MNDLDYMRKLAGIGEPTVNGQLPASFTDTTPRSLNARKVAAEEMRQKMSEVEQHTVTELPPPKIDGYGWLKKPVTSK